MSQFCIEGSIVKVQRTERKSEVERIKSDFTKNIIKLLQKKSYIFVFYQFINCYGKSSITSNDLLFLIYSSDAKLTINKINQKSVYFINHDFYQIDLKFN